MNNTTKIFAIALLGFLSFALVVNNVHASPYLNQGESFWLFSGEKVRIGNWWISTSETAMRVSALFSQDWFNYTVVGSGIQEIYEGQKPTFVTINGINYSEGDGWTCSANIVTVKTALTNASLFYGVISDSALGEWDALFVSLLYGQGSYFGLTIIAILLIGLFLKWKETAVISVPIFLLLGISWLNHNLPYQAVISFIGATFIILTVAKENVK